MSQTPNTAIAVIGIDIGKNSFHTSWVTMRAAPSSCGKSGRVVRLVPGRASLRPSQVPAQDSAERPLPKQGPQAWEVEEELEEVLFATPGRPAREDLDVGCWKSSTGGCWKSSAAAPPDSVGSSPAPSARRVDGLFFSNPPVGLRSSA
jgi:hypothetical protein